MSERKGSDAERAHRQPVARAVPAGATERQESRRAAGKRPAKGRAGQERDEARAVERRLAFLAEASKVLSSSLDYEATLQSVAHLAVPALADWCFVDVDEGGSTRRVAIAHVDPAKEELARELWRRYLASGKRTPNYPTALLTGRSVIVPEVADEWLERIAVDSEDLRLLREMAPKSYMLVPLVARGRSLGLISFVVTESDRRYGQGDLELAEELAWRSAVAVDNARLYEAERNAHAVAERERQRAEEYAADRERLLTQLDAERARWQATVESMVDPVTVADAEGRAIYMNPAYSQLIGRQIAPELDLEGHPTYYQLYRPDGTLFEPEELPLQRAALRGEVVRNIEVIQRAADGREFIGVFNAAPLRDPNGQVVGAVAVGRDITEQKQAEAERERLLARLREANEQLTLAAIEVREQAERAEAARVEAEQQAARMSALLTSLRESVTVLDASGRIVLRNQATREMTGVPDEEARSVADYGRARILRLDGTPVPFERWPANRLLAGEPFADEEHLLERQDGSRRRVVSSGGVVRDERGRVALAVIVSRDVTELRRLEQMREEYVSLISHDLRNPLTSLRGQAQLLQRALTQRGLAREVESVETILKSARRMSSMIQDLVESVRLESGRLEMHVEPTDLPHLVVEVVGRLGTPEERARVRVEAGDWVPLVAADPERIERAIVNLITNALKYSPPGSPVVVRVAPRDAEVVVSVVDRGVGISPEDLPHLFERFYRANTASKAEGLGLGLYITRLIVEAHGGRIRVESQPGEGSTFSFTLWTVRE